MSVTGARAGTGSARRAWRVRPSTIIGVTVLVLIVVSAIFAGVLYPQGPSRTNFASALAPPVFFGGTFAHPLGTDQLGRDVLARIVYGARISLIVGIVSVAIAAPVGVLLGLISGYAGRQVETVLTALIDIQLSIPVILLIIAIVTVLGPGLANVIVSIAIAGWPTYARLVRSETLVVVRQDYADAARALGAGHTRILLRHVLPNVLTPVIVFATFAIADAIVLEATLSFLGLGVPASVVTWGSMLNEGRFHLLTAWWITAFPGLAIFISVLAINLLGDELRDRLDPRLRNVI